MPDPIETRRQLPTHRVRHYTYVFGSVGPHDKELIGLILLRPNAAAMPL